MLRSDRTVEAAMTRTPLRWLAVGFALASAPAWAQDPADEAPPAEGDPATEPEPEPPPPSIDEALTFLNELLAANPSPWRPCRAASSVELSEDGYLSVLVTRAAYCEDAQLRAHVRDLDPAAIEVVVEQQGALSLPCRGGDTCGRYAQKRKERVDDAWQVRDDDWVPRGPPGQPHLIDALTLEMASDAKVAALASSSLAYIARSAAAMPAYAPPADPFQGRMAVGPSTEAAAVEP